jgi:hypothetical protein
MKALFVCLNSNESTQGRANEQENSYDDDVLSYLDYDFLAYKLVTLRIMFRSRNFSIFVSEARQSIKRQMLPTTINVAKVQRRAHLQTT